MRSAAASALAVLALLAAPTAASAKPTYRCLLVVNGRTFLSGPCNFQPNGDDGSFEITKEGNPYFAYLNIDSNEAYGSWNETPDSTHADASLGLMKRRGACWVNVQRGMSGGEPGTNKICVWKR